FYFPMYEAALSKHNVPLEIKYLSIVESALNPKAVSRVGATGLWQMMYGTGKLMGLKIDTYVDERRDPYLATKAGVAYLKYLYDIYGDWLLAIGAYNCGPGNMNKAIRKAGGGDDLTFWDLWNYLPAETRSYVPIFIAATYSFTYHKEHNIVPQSFGYEYNLIDTIMITRKMTLEQLSAYINMSVDEIKLFNPALKTNTIPGYPIAFPVRLPMEAIAMYYANQTELYASLDKPVSNPVITKAETETLTENTESNEPVKVTYSVKKGDNLGYISDWFDCTVADVKKWNSLKTTKIVPGQKLTLYVPASAQTHYASINKMTMSEKQKLTDVQIVGTDKTGSEPEYVFYTVKPGDTLWAISQRYPENSIDKIREMNDISKNETLKVGDKIKLVK
ncbi:MAG: transglycosylase SLT domain-containing protein, partial [Chitinophagales bacterium]